MVSRETEDNANIFFYLEGGGEGVNKVYLTIIPRARMGYWLRGLEGERNNCFSKIQLVGQEYRDKQL